MVSLIPGDTVLSKINILYIHFQKTSSKGYISRKHLSQTGHLIHSLKNHIHNYAFARDSNIYVLFVFGMIILILKCVMAQNSNFLNKQIRSKIQ